MEFSIPQSLKMEHEELHRELAKATETGGKIGAAAKAVSKILHPHFVDEEEFAMPPLGLLTLLAEGKITPGMGMVLKMTDKLRSELPRMLDEHKKIVAALDKLAAVAAKESKRKYARFADKLMLHARNEEEVVYPAAILVGEYLKIKLAKQGPSVPSPG